MVYGKLELAAAVESGRRCGLQAGKETRSATTAGVSGRFWGRRLGPLFTAHTPHAPSEPRHPAVLASCPLSTVPISTGSVMCLPGLVFRLQGDVRLRHDRGAATKLVQCDPSEAVCFSGHAKDSGSVSSEM